jgi:CRP-like cAMP-binding protein
MSAWTEENIGRFLEETEVFKGIPSEHISALAGKARVHALESSQAILKRGESGNSLFVLASGMVRVTLDLPRGQEDVSTLQPGDFFGEIGMMTQARRTATVTATQESVVLEFSAADILPLCERYPDFKARIARTGATRSRESLEKIIEE